MKIDDVTCTLKIDGNLWEGRDKAVHRMDIIDKHEYRVPVLVIVISDQGNNIGKSVMLNDGCKLEVQWGQGDVVNTSTFRLAKYTVKPQNNTNVYVIFGWMDNVKLLVDCNNKSYKGTSSEVIAKVAGECGLKSDCDPTQDNQTWIAGNDTNAVFLKKVAKKGYGGKDALMNLTTSIGVIRYKDMNKIANSGPLLGFIAGMGTPKDSEIMGAQMKCLPMVDWTIEVKSGVTNLMQGYKATQADTNIGDVTKEGTILDIPIMSMVNSLSMGKTITDQITTPKLKPGNVKTDNTHDNYNGSDYTNGRGNRILRNARVNLVTNRLTNLSPFDLISVKFSGVIAGATGSDGNENTQFDGPYVVYCRTVFIQGNIYGEKIICDREGVMTS
jgi:hypothetical protein